MKLLPASVNPVEASQSPEVSTSLAPLTQRGITARASQTTLVAPADAFAWSSSSRRGEANRIDATFVDDSPSDSQSKETGPSAWEYVSGWAWSRPVEITAVAHYLSYAAGLAGWSGGLIDLYA
ncbi:MAG: hypothetical protein WBX38_04490 [Candidatus Sulfotelmatobacter sp.]